MHEIDFTRPQEPAPVPPRTGRLALPAILMAAAVVAGSAVAIVAGDRATGKAIARVELVPERTPEVLLVVLPASPPPEPPGATPTPEYVSEPEAQAQPALSGRATDPQPAVTVPPAPAGVPSPSVPGPLAGVTAWSGGDSTSYYMTVAFLAMVGRAGGVAVVEPGYVVSSGLLNPNLHDWPANLASEMAAYDPQVVVFMLGANDANTAAANPEAYRAKVAGVMDQLQAPGRTVAWVGQPTMGRDDLAASVPVVNRIFEEEAAKRPWVTYIDAFALTADASGGFATHLPGPGGELQLMRADDGVHLTPAAGDRIARSVFAALFPGVPVP